MWRLLTTCSCAALACAPALTGAVAVRNVTVIPMTTADVLRRYTVLIQNGRIVRLGPDSEVTIMAGSDVAAINIFPGHSLHEDLELFVDSVGMSPLEALASATRESAAFLGLADSVGTIAEGKLADLVLLDADPLARIANSRRIAAVILRGKAYHSAGLDSLLDAVGRMPDQTVNDWTR